MLILQPTGIQIGPLVFHYYGLIIAGGIAAGLLLLDFRIRKEQLNTNHVLNLAFWMVLSGLVGARFWHLLTPPGSMTQAGFTTRFYLTHPLDALSIWNGGLGLPGAILGIGVSLLVYCRRHRLPFLRLADVFTPVWLLVHSIGVWGNYLTQSSYGKPSSQPWAIGINPEHRLPGYEQVATYHPLFLYTCLLNVGFFILLLVLERRMKNETADGILFTIFLAGFGVVHFLLEFIRLDVSFWGRLPVNQVFMGGLAGFALAAWLLYNKHTRDSTDPNS